MSGERHQVGFIQRKLDFHAQTPLDHSMAVQPPALPLNHNARFSSGWSMNRVLKQVSGCQPRRAAFWKTQSA
jgi:hypothetical protein